MSFKPGISGNPNGRPMGSQNKRVKLATLLEPFAEELILKAVELAREGDMNALRLCIERLIPKAKQEPISFDLSKLDLDNHEYLGSAGKEIMIAVTSGEISLTEGKLLSLLIDNQRKLLENCELTHKLEAIEKSFESSGLNSRKQRSFK